MTIMTIVAVSFGLSAFFDVLLCSVRSLWRFRVILSMAVLVTTEFSAIALFFSSPSVWSGLFFVVGIYRIFATLRIVQGRIHEAYLRQVARRSALVLLIIQAALLLARLGWDRHHFSEQAIDATVTSIMLVSSILLLASTVRRHAKTRWPTRGKQYTENELPSITVAIPARNETEDLEACLESVIASNYPKLEIIVYDDCSQERRTPEIIRGFAHDGVRFINGQEPITSWLAKNTAYNRLYEESNGEYIVFCGVDIRFGADSLMRLISFMKTSKKQMVSVLPRRGPAVYGHFALIQAMRYWWELVPPRRFFSRPPVMGSCWVIQREALKKTGAFAAVSRSVVPEAYFARKLLAHDHYSFRRADEHLGIVSAKRTSEQRDTAVRVRYPQLHQRPELVMVVTWLELGLLVAPFALLIFGGPLRLSVSSWLRVGFTCVLLTIGYMVVALSAHINRRWFSVIGLPIVVLTDVGILHYSMWRYEFSVVDWKGRNVCVPTMHVIPQLPKLPD